MEIFNIKSGILVDIKPADLSSIDAIMMSCRDIPYIAGFKINSNAALKNGLQNVLVSVKKQTGKPLIYDHQKLGSDAPDICSGDLLEVIKSSGADGIVVFPLSGKKVLESIIEKCSKIGLLPIVSGDLSYNGYFNDEGGYIYGDTQQRIYLEAASLGVSHFMMSCNRIDRIKIYCHELGSIVGQIKIFFTAIETRGCEKFPEACSQIKQNKAFAVFSEEFISAEKFINNLSIFWETFSKKLNAM